ncbi:MAG: winged helix-turn-helix domain-containing protein [Bacteroidales bacterium]|nr:winged helix-turn-helix domain-containing protein [Bacteroidales bacterium]
MQNFIGITIPFEKNTLNDTHSGTHEETLVNTGTGTENGTHNGTHEQTIINLIRENKNVTHDLMAEKCGVSVRTISRILREMKDKVVYVGSGDKGHWEIISK